jgi:putative transposase
VYRRPRYHNEIYRTIELWRTSPTEAEQPYVFLNGMRRSQRIVARRNARVFREILGICEGAKAAAAGWSASVEHLRECGPKELPLIVSDAFSWPFRKRRRVLPRRRRKGAWFTGIAICSVACLRPSTKIREIAGCSRRSTSRQHPAKGLSTLPTQQDLPRVFALP